MYSTLFAWLIIAGKDFVALFENLTAMMLGSCYSMFLFNKHKNRIEEDNVKIAILLPIVFCSLLAWIRALICIL